MPIRQKTGAIVEAKAGDAAKSRIAYKQFLSNWRVADPKLPELAEARAALSGK